MSDQQTTLLPCPFCGGEPTSYAIEPHSHSAALKAAIPTLPDHPGSHVIECGCGCGLIDETEEAVVIRWNRRALPFQEAAADIAKRRAEHQQRVDEAHADIRRGGRPAGKRFKL